MSADKIVIDITETITTRLNPDGSTQSTTGMGLLSVNNPSSSNRLWNLKLKNAGTSEAVGTTLPQEASKDVLDPGQSWQFDYDISNLKGPLLKVEEIFDTSTTAAEVNDNFVVKSLDHAEITLILTNSASSPASKILLKKTIPGYMKEVAIGESSTGVPAYDINTREFTWEVPVLQGGESASIKIKGRLDMPEPATKSGNPVDITYQYAGIQRSAVSPAIKALTDTMTGVDQEEDGSRPGWWKCVVEFENESEFEVTVESLKVAQKIATGEEVLVDIKPGEVVGPKQEWSHQFSMESPTVPTLSPQLDFTANHAVPTRIIGSIHQEAKSFDVLQTTTSKKIDPPSVTAHANTDMTITNTVSNVGTASIDSLVLHDVLPKDFEPPALDLIECMVKSPLNEVVAKLAKENAKITLAPQDKDTTKPHELTIEFSGLDGVFKPGHVLITSYPLVARNPQPNTVYETPVTVQSFTLPKGPAYDDKPEELPVIGIQYVQRKVKTAKSISPAGENAFNVTIKLSNKGEIELEHITLEETIPSGFTAGSFEPSGMAPEFTEGPAGSKLQWSIPRLDAGQDIKIKYVSEGTGDFLRTEPVVNIAEPEQEKAAAPAATKEDKGLGQLGMLTDIFSDLFVKLEAMVPHVKAGDLLLGLRDELLEKGKGSTIMRDIMHESEELKKLGDKMLMGDALEILKGKINAWKERLMG